MLSAPADGYTLALLSNGTAISVSLFKSLGFNPVTDFVPVSSMGYFDFIFVTQAGSPYPTLADFIKAAKAKPGALNVGTINVGSTQNLAAQLFKSTAGVDVTIVPFRSSPDVLIALLRGDIQMAIENYSAVQSHVADKAAIAVSSSGSVRTSFLPDVPTVKEAGGGDFEARSWNAIFAPKGTPPEVIETLNAALREVLDMPELEEARARSRHRGQGQLARGNSRPAEGRYRQMGRGDRAGRNCQTIVTRPVRPATCNKRRRKSRS